MTTFGKHGRTIAPSREILDRAMVQAHADVVRRHRLLGIPLVIWRDGQVVEVPADEVLIPTSPPSEPPI